MEEGKDQEAFVRDEDIDWTSIHDRLKKGMEDLAAKNRTAKSDLTRMPRARENESSD
jgi:hypothetical protein